MTEIPVSDNTAPAHPFDTTPSVRQRQALREDDDFVRRVFETSHIHQAIVNSDGTIVSVNEAWRRFAEENGGAQENTWGVGANYFEVCKRCVGRTPGEDSDSARCALEGLIAAREGTVPAFEIEYPCHSPTEKRWFILHVQKMKGEPPMLLVSHTNVTALKLTEAKLERRIRFERIISSTSSIFMRGAPHDISEGIEQGLGLVGDFARADRACSCVFPIGAVEGRRDHWTAPGINPSTPPLNWDEAERWLPEFFQSIRSGRSVHRRNRSPTPAEMTRENAFLAQRGIGSLLAVPMVHGGIVVGFLCLESTDGRADEADDVEVLMRVVGEIFANAVEQKRSSDRERRMQKNLARLERAESVGKLAGGVAHDLNNVLGPLVGYPALILDEIDPQGDAAKMVREMEAAATRASQVIQDLLTLSRRGAYSLVALDLNDVVKACVASQEFRWLMGQNAGVEVVVDVREPGLPSICGSTSHLSRALMNLVRNAIEAMQGVGALTISTTVRHCDEKGCSFDTITEGDYAVLSVRDTGSGITDEILGRIFEPFYTTHRRNGGGTGLGLAVVHGVVKEHGGYIDVRTKVGSGSEFLMYFPITSLNREPESADSPSVKGGTESILVVDDREDQRMLAQRVLSRLGYRVTTTASGRAAVEYLRKHEVNLVLLDMIMEEQFDGLDAYRAITNVRPGQRCIIVSGYAETDRVKEAQALGADDFLRKPYQISELDHKIREVLDRGKASRGS